MVLYDGSGNSFVGLLGLAFRAGAQWGRGTRYNIIGMMHRVEQVMNQAEDYEYLLALFMNEIPKSEAKDLLVQWLWRLWCISRRECPPLVHARNKKIHQTKP